MNGKPLSMQLLLVQLLSLVSLASPLSSCNKENPGVTSGKGATIYTVSQHSPDRDSVNQTISGARRNAITVAVAKASPAVVGINVTATQEVQYRQFDPFGMFNDPYLRQFFGDQGGVRTQKYQVKALGSGFIISPDGYILTNDHVAGNATKIIITTTEGAEYDAKLIGTDHNADVSLLKIDGKNLPYLRLGSSGDLAVGEWAIAMGNPFGLFSINDKPTVTVGVVSNTGVNLGLEEGRNYRDMIQTDAAISSGNSGGPLLNANGEVIGMNAVIRSTSQNMQGEAGSIGLGFAIPIDRIRSVVDRLRSGEKTDHNIGDLGMVFGNLTDEAKQYFKIRTDIGVVVTGISHGGPADRAGIRAGDLIIGLDNDKIRGMDELESAVMDHQVGDRVTFHIQREGQNSAVRMTLPGK
jgi:serine protease Do